MYVIIDRSFLCVDMGSKLKRGEQLDSITVYRSNFNGDQADHWVSGGMSRVVVVHRVALGPMILQPGRAKLIAMSTRSSGAIKPYSIRSI